MISRSQQYPVARRALRALLILVKTFSEQLAANDSPNSPQPYGKSNSLLSNVKDVLERVANGRSLDGLMDAFARVVRGLTDAPPCSAESSTQNDDSVPPSPAATAPVSLAEEVVLPARPKGKRNKKARTREKKAAERAAAQLAQAAALAEMQAAAAQSAQAAAAAVERTWGARRAYFVRLAEWLDRALDYGAVDEVLGTLVEEGVALLGGATPGTAPEGSVEQAAEEAAEACRREFAADVARLANEFIAHVTAIQNDAATAGILRSLPALDKALSDLFAESTGFKTWVPWAAWAVPRILRMLPVDALPIPVLEGHTPSSSGTFTPTPDASAVIISSDTEVRVDTNAEHVHIHVGGIGARAESIAYTTSRAGTCMQKDTGTLTLKSGVTLALDLALAPNSPDTSRSGAPPFRVLAVDATLDAAALRIAQSTNWLLTTRVGQHFSVPGITRLMQRGVEARVRASLESLAEGLGVVALAARKRGGARQVDAGGDDENTARKLGDWWCALLAHAPALFRRTPAAHMDTDTWKSAAFDF